jgi:hypothetical protein
MIWETTIPQTAFTAEGGWFRFKVPDVLLTTPFYVSFRTNSPPTYGVTVFYDTSRPNTGSDIFSQGAVLPVTAWPSWMDPANTNWLIRVKGASSDVTKVITTPLAPAA